MTKFGKLKLKNPTFLDDGSSKKVEWVCDCGNETIKKYNNVVSGHTKTCGKCNIISSDFFKSTKFGNLKLLEPCDLKPSSSKKVEWVCDCGKTLTTTVYNVVSGHTKTCGKCDIIPIESIKGVKFGNLTIETPMGFKPSSAKKVVWVCDCGNTKKITFNAVYSGHTKTCGKCNTLSSDYIKENKFGKLRMKNPQCIKPGSDKKVEWVCDCGNTTLISIKCVIEGLSKSCGRCSIIPASQFSTLKFGKLRMKNPQDSKPGSGKKVEWVCDCGNEITTTINRVTHGFTTTCGKCIDTARINFKKFKEKINSEGFPKYPIKYSDNLVAWFGPQHDITSGGVAIKSTCPACGNTHNTRFSDILRGSGLTCGCCTYKVSMAQQNLHKFIENLGIDASVEHEVNGLKYDIFVPSNNLLIEYNGLRWHSMEGSKSKDIKKYEHAIKHGFKFISIFEDEWIKHREIIEKLVKNRLGVLHAKPVRPNKCQFSRVSSKQADKFYENHHYIGKCQSRINYGAFYLNTMVACISMKRPTRQSKYDWELVRMTSNSQFRVHGVWNKLLNMFINEYHPKSIVSFSDNRLFTGNVYEKLGFMLDGQIKPDYYWCKGINRFHKSSLRKPQGEKRTESEIREQQGFKKIWDVGKKRYVITFS